MSVHVIQLLFPFTRCLSAASNPHGSAARVMEKGQVMSVCPIRPLGSLILWPYCVLLSLRQMLQGITIMEEMQSLKIQIDVFFCDNLLDASNFE